MQAAGTTAAASVDMYGAVARARDPPCSWYMPGSWDLSNPHDHFGALVGQRMLATGGKYLIHTPQQLNLPQLQRMQVGQRILQAAAGLLHCRGALQAQRT